MYLFGQPVEGIILDVDGVIIEFFEPMQRCLISVANEFGLPIEPIRDYYFEVHGGRRHNFSNLLDDGIRQFWPSLDDEAATCFAWRFQELKRADPWPEISGSVETINWLRMMAVPTALCTTNDLPTLKLVLGRIGIMLDQFVAMSTWETGFHKPDPRCLDPVYAALPVPHEHLVYIGDWYPDIDLARNAGLRFHPVLTGGIPRKAFWREGVPVNHVFNRLSDLQRYLVRS